MRRSANVVGVVSLRFVKTLTSPLFSATKTRPSAAKRIVDGFASPLKTVRSWKPAGSVAACAAPLQMTAKASVSAAVATAMAVLNSASCALPALSIFDPRRP